MQPSDCVLRPGEAQRPPAAPATASCALLQRGRRPWARVPPRPVAPSALRGLPHAATRHAWHDTACLLQVGRDQAERLLDHGEALLKDWQHPNPIISERRRLRQLRLLWRAGGGRAWQAAPGCARRQPILRAILIKPAPGALGGHGGAHGGRRSPLLTLGPNPRAPPAAPYYVGGTAFARNPPMPENVSAARRGCKGAAP